MNIRLPLRIMMCLMVFASGHLYVHAEHITPDKDDLLKVIRDISQRYNVHFTYDREIVEDVEIVEYAPGSYASVEDALSSVLAGTSLKYVMLEMKYVIIYQDDAEGMKSLEQMVEVLEQIIDQKKENRLVATLDKLETPSRLTPTYLVQRRMVLNVSGTVTDQAGEPLIGVNVLVEGTNMGTATDLEGRFSLEDVNENATLIFSYVGYQTQEFPLNGRFNVTIIMTEDLQTLDEVVVVGYGTQKKSDITGSVSSIKEERLDMLPNMDIAQAIQGAIPGVLMQTSSAGAAPSNSNSSILIRGRNSIRASNNPLIVVDGIPYSGQLRDINPNDVKSIEVLKDASASAIYGSRGANGVILVTTKSGKNTKAQISYDGYYSMQRFTKLPDVMDGEQFYQFKMQREPNSITQSEQEVYDSGEWVDWLDLALRNGASTQHNLSVSGGFQNTTYYVSGGITDVKGLAINDDFKRLTGRVNINTKVADWFTIGTRSQFSHDDKSGIAPTWDGDQGVFWFNPLTRAFDEEGNLTIYPWKDDPYFRNPLMGTLADDNDKSYQILSNNFAIVDFPFIEGLQYRINAGIRIRFADRQRYYGRNTLTGLENRGDSYTSSARANNLVVENILHYTKELGRSHLDLTALYSYENDKDNSSSISANGFPHDFLKWYSAGQAELIDPNYSYSTSTLISQMIRLNYSFNSRFMLTLTARRDGYSGFGENTKWGVFPSVAAGWNLANEQFLSDNNLIDELKLRTSWGLNGNQAVGAYQTISRLAEENYVTGSTTLPGYKPNKLGEDNLGWESTETLNIGLDYVLLSGKIYGDINLYKSNTFDLLLNRSISDVHGISSITQNIGETENKGLEVSLTSRNVTSGKFSWETSGNISINRNKIVSLYGEVDEQGNEVDDINNEWFIGQPIRVNFGHVWDGIWQKDEAERAALYGTQPGFLRIRDVNGDTAITADDRIIIGQRDPKLLWGLNNTFKFNNLVLNIFMHGVHGVTKSNPLLSDNVYGGVRRNTTVKNWWTPENPSTEWYMNHEDANKQDGIGATPLENASFVRIKDITLSYDLAGWIGEKIGFNKLQLYFTGRNLFTFTEYGGLDPELSGQRSIPLQKEYVVGLNLGF